MPRISLAFFSVASLCGLCGMLWGAYMGATQNFTMAPAHAHLNLLGWVTLSLMGGFYALNSRAVGRLAWSNFWFSSVGTIATVPLLAWLLAGHEREAERGLPLTETFVIVGMLMFVVNVLRQWPVASAWRVRSAEGKA